MFLVFFSFFIVCIPYMCHLSYVMSLVVCCVVMWFVAAVCVNIDN